MADAGIKLEDGLYAEFHTSKGVITAQLLPSNAPMTVMNFIGLAEGTTAWTEPTTNEMVKRPLYSNLSFHRVRDFMVQSGDPTNSGTGDPGYIFADEIDPRLSHLQSGMLTMANKGPNTNGSQFFITRKSAEWLDGNYTIFGHVIDGLEVVNDIVANDKLHKVAIRRIGAIAENFNEKYAHKMAEKRKSDIQYLMFSRLPEKTMELDPARIPQKDQQDAASGVFDFIFIGHSEIKGAEHNGKTYHLDRASAIEFASRLSSLARSKGISFNSLIDKYSDMPLKIPPQKIENNHRLPKLMSSIFKLHPGQVGDPLDFPDGIYIFHRER